MNDPRTQLKELIHVEKAIIPANLCDYIIQDNSNVCGNADN